jgi:hypothetical protein
LIIQVVGTNGAGKSTVVRSVMAAGAQTPVEREGKVQGYDVTLPGVDPLLHVLGAYDAPTGGCDTIKSVIEIYARVAQASGEGCHVLFEGIRALNQTRGPVLASQVAEPFVVLLLDTPLGVSLQSINVRRNAKGSGAFTADTRDIENNHTRARNYAARMRDVGAKVVRASRDTAPPVILDLLRSA